jgi:iron(III) transport system permease protein
MERAPVTRAAWARVRRPRSFVPVLGTAIAAIVLLLLGYPVLKVLLGLSGQQKNVITSTFDLPGIGQVLINTVIVVGAASLISIAAAACLAWVVECSDARLGVVGRILPYTPLVMPPVTTAIGWTFLLSPQAGYLNVLIRDIASAVGINISTGPLNIFSWPGLILAYSAYLVPYAYLPIAAALRNVDPAYEEAARTCGTGRLKTFIRVNVPLVKPAIASGAVLVVIIALGLFSVPVIIGTTANHPVLTVRIVELLTQSYPPDTGSAVTLSTLILVVVGLASFAQGRLSRSSRMAVITGRAHRSQRSPLGRWRLPVEIIVFAFLACVAVLPFLSILLVSFQPYWSPAVHHLSLENYRQVFFADSVTSSSLLRSIELAVVTATIGVLAATVLATWARQSRPAVGRMLSFTAGLPGSVSHVVIATGFILGFSGGPFYLAGTARLLFLCYLVLNFPQMYFTASSAVSQVGREMSEASAVSGARPLRTLTRVVMPLSVGGLLAGWSLVFVLVLGDLTASVLLSGTSNAVVGFQIVELYQNGTYSELAALSVVVSVVAACILILVGAIPRLIRKLH